MLSGKGKPSEAIGSHIPRKDSAVLMEPSKGLVELPERVFSDDVPASNITELKECRKRSDNVQGDEPLDRIQVYLDQKVRLRRSTWHHVVAIAYLHQGLGVVSGPLIEFSPLLEPA